MPRKREGTVKESLEELRELEERYRGKPEEVRVTVLRLLKEEEDRGIEDVALLVGFSKPTVKRWWRTYREGGIDALIGIATSTRRVSTIDEQLNSLKQKLLAGEFNGIDAVREWIDSHPQRPKRDVAGSKNGLPRSVGAKSMSIVTLDHPHDPSDRLFAFLDALPSTHTIKEWSSAFIGALQSLLGDVDRVSVSVNARCDLLNPEGYQPNLFITQSVYSGARAINRVVPPSESKDENPHLERLFDNLRKRKFPFSQYQPPVPFVYYYLEAAFLGVIVLWRERSKPPISERTLMLMERLNGFIEYILSDFAARYQNANPIEHVFEHALEGLAERIGLTMQERRIMILQLLGSSYEEIATTLSISLNTVRYHLRSIYQKTGTHSQAELFAKYFTPRFDPDQVSDKDHL